MDNTQVKVRRIVDRLLHANNENKYNPFSIIGIAIAEKWSVGEAESIIKMLKFFDVGYTYELKASNIETGFILRKFGFNCTDLEEFSLTSVLDYLQMTKDEGYIEDHELVCNVIAMTKRSNVNYGSYSSKLKARSK